MELKKYHMEDVALVDVDNDTFVGTAYFCDKDDYETEEDSLEMFIDGEITVFYQSEIQSIEAI
ncbi:hypothetical protein BN1356_02229 [Streptococcus varani]|uniref:Uncharacterized protein n=1 Tax=Streptococcus varani TaxID=1608583 RepID=A0A0E4CTL3_9STRE|nr:hypothetical protein [Streptococcus varani]CQR25882.1 hypothetical protein BN1356_02229 [Streptococcus varani]